MELKIVRNEFFKDTTIGKLFIDGAYFSLVLEDARRLPGIKIPDETCVPAGRYRVTVTKSTRFKRMMPMIFNCANGYELKAEGISFKGIRMHGGNNHKHTAGCPLVAYNRINDTTIHGSAEKDLTKLITDTIDNNEEVWLRIADVI